MSFGTYLDKYRSTLNSSQGQQLLKVLVKKRDAGEIRTLDEFKAKFQELTKKLLENQIKPTMKVLRARGGAETSSQRYNEMLERIQDDLETCFTESENIEDVMAAHHNLIDGVALKAIRYGINELESRVTLYEFLSQNGMGFNHALFNTFAESEKFSISRSDEDAAITYSDFRKGELIGAEEDCLIDLVGERLSLGLSEGAYALVQKAEWLANVNSLRGELDVSFANSNINNVIDGKNNTYWIEPILLSAVRNNGITIEIAITLASTVDINFLDIEPASDYPMTLSLVDYIDTNSIRQTISAPELEIVGPTRVNFPRVSTPTLILRFTQKNYREIQFTPKIGVSNFHRAVLGEKNFGIDMDSASEDLKNALSSDYILSTVMNVPDYQGELVKYFEYIVGFDNLRPGYNRYNERGVFSSIGQSLDTAGEFALKVIETRPYQKLGYSDIETEVHTYPLASGEENDKFYHSSVEYWLTVKSYAINGTLLATNTVPILPFGSIRVYHERLLLTNMSSASLTANDQGALRFFCDADSSDVKVYRNSELLTYGASSDWEFVPENGTGANNLLTYTTPNAGLKMSRGIWIKSTIQPLDIYTVSYTPEVSNTRASKFEGNTADKQLFSIVDMTGDNFLRVFKDGLLLVSPEKGGQTVATTNVYLTIIMRRNSAAESFTPFVDEFMLLTASIAPSRFEGKL